MSKYLVIYLICLTGWSLAFAEDLQGRNEYDRNTDARHFHKKRRCHFGSCGGGFGNYGGFGGYQGGYGGYQGGYGGYQGGPYPPINIGISQSQSSASGGYGYNPNYNQYNGYQGYPNYGYNRPYNRPFFGNGYGPTNNQFNGNYYLANTGNGYGLTGFGGGFDEQYDGDEHFERSASKKD
ncbi:heterogeneous nuclear ribonucleoprotein A2 homolog 2-like [Zerene cesonia]|uniref:heterogeneous nuclear ribonucleoprotein A2 homolog 2-like n=1 Tax=Zerene cesonia TaxID=33412 RepID=UPI0018E58603|nr:heterogeneous nuclear ribonucleoprotein A2 homolog 2-like [Zerene cesonia]